jgi:hypothetical protein
MAQSHPWMSLAEASSVLGIPEFQVLELAIADRLRSRLVLDHREICADDVDEFVSEFPSRTADAVAEHADKPTWKPWIDPDFRREQADYTDTPSDEESGQ